MRVKEGYYDTLEFLTKTFDSRKLLRIKEVADYLGIDSRTAKKRFSFKDGYISVVTLAREMC